MTVSMMWSTSCMPHDMAIDKGLARLRPRFLCRYTPCIAAHARPSSMAVVQSSSLAVYVVWGRSGTTAWVKSTATCPGLVLRIWAAVDVMDVSLECVGNLSLVLLSLAAVLAVPIILLTIRPGLILSTLISLPSSGISSVSIEVLFRSLSTHFGGCMLWLGSRTCRSFHVRCWSTSSPSRGRGLISILLNDVDGLLHCWWALATSSAIAWSWVCMRLHDIIWTGYRVIRTIPAVVFIILVLRNVM